MRVSFLIRFALLFVSVYFAGISSLSVNAMSLPDDDEMDIHSCSSYSAEQISKLLSAMRERLPVEYGAIANDSIQILIKRIETAFANNQLLLQAKPETWKKDTTSFPVWQKKLFAGVKTTEDSIQAVCRWIPANFVLSDPNEEARKWNAASMYKNFLNGKAQGDAYSFADFLCKVAQQFPGWGTPVLIQTAPDSSIKDRGLFPLHYWVGFANKEGKIWCVTDPTVGSMVKDKKTGKAVSLDSVLVYTKSEKKYTQLVTEPTPLSLQSTAGCLFRFLLRNTEKTSFFLTEGSVNSFARAAWFSFAEEGSFVHALLVPYWTKRGYAGKAAVNIYAENGVAFIPEGNSALAPLIMKHYNLRIQ